MVFLHHSCVQYLPKVANVGSVVGYITRVLTDKKYTAQLSRAGLSQWNAAVLCLSLDTTMLWNEFCIVRVSVVYRGRAVPVAWRVLAHASISVKFDTYKLLLNRVAGILPTDVKIILLTDRGFVDIELMRHCRALNWNYRIRVKPNFWVCRPKKQPIQIKQFYLGLGEAILFHNLKVTKTDPYGLVSLALGRESIGGEFWAILSNETTSLQTFRESGLRFAIEENFLDDKSNGFNLERSEIRSSTALSRLCLVLASATLYLTSIGTQVVDIGKRRFVDPHWHRGSSTFSYLRIGVRMG